VVPVLTVTQDLREAAVQQAVPVAIQAAAAAADAAQGVLILPDADRMAVLQIMDLPEVPALTVPAMRQVLVRHHQHFLHTTSLRKLPAAAAAVQEGKAAAAAAAHTAPAVHVALAAALI
jgi:hypothetical protein